MKRILQYILMTFGFSWTVWGIQYLAQEGILPEWAQIFGMFGMFGPFIAFMLLIKKDVTSYKKAFKKLFSKPPSWTLVFVIVSPMILSAIAYIVYRQYANGEIEGLGVSLVSFLPTLLMILFIGGPIEEFGWRGYLLPRLREKYPFLLTILMMGIIHGVWHLPLHYLNGTVQEAIPIYEFLIITIAITVSYVFIFEFTRSIIPFILLHWLSNFSSAVFPYFYNVEGRYALLIVTLIMDVILIAIYYHRKRKALVSEKPI